MFGVFHHGTRRHNKRPVARLGQQELPSQLVKGVPLKAPGVGEIAGGPDHALRRHVQVAVKPVVAPVEPHFMVAVISPAGGGRLRFLQGQAQLQVFTGSNGGENFLVTMRFAEKVFQPSRAFIPPVSKKFSVIRRHHDGRAAHPAGCIFNLAFAVKNKIARVFSQFFLCRFGVIRFFMICLTGDAVILKAGVDTNAVGVDIRPDIVKGQVIPDIAVKITVGKISRVAFRFTPDLFARFFVPAESGHAGGSDNWTESAVGRARDGIIDTVRSKEKIVDSQFRQKLVQAVVVGTFGQPDAAGRRAEKFRMLFYGKAELGINRLRLCIKEGQVGVGGCGSDQFHFFCFSQVTESGDQVTLVAFKIVIISLLQAEAIHSGQRGKGGIAGSADYFLVGQVQQPGKISMVFSLEVVIPPHGGQGGGNGDGDPERDTVLMQAGENS